ncbi:Scr1 family TA system antitoxin-like transcriptional regulator [Streptomyces sp. NPDC001787]|uniref:Scr1 family TA system antitoxin-like transcriptional regulator n=1 Tax=Streptomyces sp. NPDC001787 TaxID=3154523 RepID=UPI0033180AF9
MTERQPHPAALVVGAVLRDARERRLVLPEESAALLGVLTETLFAIETGHRAIGARDITRLCLLYRTPEDAPALQKMAAVLPPLPTGSERPLGTAELLPGPVSDTLPGHGQRLAAVCRQATRLYMVTTWEVQPQLQTAEYARAMHQPPAALPGYPLPGPAEAMYALDESVITRASDSAGVMARQIAHLQRLRAQGVDIRVLPGLFPPGAMAELALPGGTLLIDRWHAPDYLRPGARQLPRSLAGPTVTGTDTDRRLACALDHYQRAAAAQSES